MLFRCNIKLFAGILAGISFNKRVCPLPSNHPSRNVAVYNKTISWKRTSSLVNILNNNKLALSNIDVVKNAHRHHRTKKPKTNSLFNRLKLSDRRGLVGSSVISDPAVLGSNSTVVNSLFLCNFFFKVRTAKISKSFTCTAMASAHEHQWSL